ncbi:unnamed protein product [Urochloa decumbens]|uniref:Uncharacterized protein n=1 Tax=Urochloa decumbens TaxID=240449 RepID=A0ABC8WZY0_9POAL
MGSCVSKKAARAGAGARGRGKVAAPLPAAEKEAGHRALPPVAEVDVEEEEVKEVVLSETPAPTRPPRPPPPTEPVITPTKAQPPEAESSEASSSEACGASDTASVASVAKETAKPKLPMKAGVEREAEKRAVVADAPPRKGRAAPDQERDGKPRGGGAAGTGRARSPSPSSAHSRRQQQHPPAPVPAARPRREQQHPPVVSGIGCRSGRFSPSAARRAAESAVRRTHSAREADMALPSSKRSLSAAINGNGGGALSRRDAGERSGRRSHSPTGSRRAPASPSAAHHRPASPLRKAAAKEHGTPERARAPRIRDDGDEQPALAGLAGGGERKKAEEGALAGQNNPSVAMECFIFL